MTDQEKLTKIIECAVENGYEWYGDLFKHWELIIAGVGFWDEDVNSYAKSDPFGRREHWSLEEVFFNHNFCKAYFGKEWQMHIQHLALSDNRIEYLWKFYNKEV